jgi:sugar phosphate isomerase/epimerase
MKSDDSKNTDIPRREFLTTSAVAACGLATGWSSLASRTLTAAIPDLTQGGQDRISFNTANLVARVTGYRYALINWMAQHQRTVAETDEAAWRQICAEIAAAGFQAVDVWEAHASPESLDRDKARTWKTILDDYGLRPISYAGGLRPETAEICQWLGIPHVDGGLVNLNPAEATRLCEDTGIAFNIENHPEHTAQEILAKIDGGNRWLGVCVDTGWLATQSAPVPETIVTIGPFVRHAHIKDVREHGTHETCLLGEGVAQVAVCLDALRTIGYEGWYSWEDEPEDRNPFESAERNLRWVRDHVG